MVIGPAILESDGQFNNVSAALTSGDIFNILGTEDVEYQPNLFYHKDAFTLATVTIPRLFSTDTIATTEDGFQIRISKYSDGDKNVQKLRMDILPAFGAMNPFYAGQGFGA